MKKVILALFLLVTVSVSFFFAAKPQAREDFVLQLKAVPQIALIGFDAASSGSSPISDFLGRLRLSDVFPVLDCVYIGGGAIPLGRLSGPDYSGKFLPYGEAVKKGRLRIDCSNGAIKLRFEAEGSYGFSRLVNRRIKISGLNGLVWISNLSNEEGVVDMEWDWGTVAVRLAPRAYVRIVEYPAAQTQFAVIKPGVSFEVQTAPAQFSKRIRFETDNTEYQVNVAGLGAFRKKNSAVLSGSGLEDLPAIGRTGQTER